MDAVGQKRRTAGRAVLEESEKSQRTRFYSSISSLRGDPVLTLFKLLAHALKGERLRRIVAVSESSLREQRR